MTITGFLTVAFFFYLMTRNPRQETWAEWENRRNLEATRRATEEILRRDIQRDRRDFRGY